MKILVFTSTLLGHHLEYIHHVYMGALERIENTYLFALPKLEWELLKSNWIWPNSTNIEFILLDDDELKNIENKSLLAKSWCISKIISNLAKTNNVDRILTIALASTIPFLPLLLPKRIRLSGIIYKIYLRSAKSNARRWIDTIRYSLMARCRSVDSVFILNDARSALELNRTYHTDKFLTLPDPVPEIDKTTLRDLREELGINPSSEVFIHIGAMDRRKGTLEIIHALASMSATELKNKTFVFAGKINECIKEEFTRLSDEARSNNAHIIVKDEFCSYEFLNNLCFTSDCILMPYLLTELSSGILGYAAVLNKPVIGPNSGLIGELIRDNNLGIVIDPSNVASITKAITAELPKITGARYVEKNNVSAFQKSLLK